MTPQDLVERALGRSRADGCVVILHDSSSANLRWAANTLTTNGVMRSTDATVVSVVDTAAGPAAAVVSRAVTDSDDLDRLVGAADEAARGAAPAPDAQPLVAGDADDSFPLPPERTSAAVFSSFAPALGEAFAAARAADRELFGFAEHSVVTTYVGSSAGLRLRHVQPTGKVEMTGKSAGRSRSTWAGRATRDFSDVDVLAITGEIDRRLDWARRQVELPAGRYDVTLPPGALSDLLVYLYWSMSAREASEGRTVFSRPGGGTRVGDPLATTPLRLYSDPYYPGLQCEPFVVSEASGSSSSVFDTGLPLAATDWVRDGRLTSLLQTRHSAGLTGLPVTPPIDNLVLDVPGGAGTLDDVVAGMDRGLLLTTLWYIREVDPQTLLLTGLTRDGVYLVEHGEVVGAVNNFRFNESPVDLLGRITAAGSTTLSLPREWNDFFTRVAMPPVRVADFNMSTVSPAS